MGVTVRRYEQLVDKARDALADGNGWRAAETIHSAVERLREQTGISKAEAQMGLAASLGRPRFSATSARRYFDLWEKYGDKDSRLVDTEGKELTFGEHYAVIRGGQRALERMEMARQSGKGIHAALQTNVSDTAEHRMMMLAARVRSEVDTLEKLIGANGIPRLERDMLKVFLLGVEDSVHHMLEQLN